MARMRDRSRRHCDGPRPPLHSATAASSLRRPTRRRVCCRVAGNNAGAEYFVGQVNWRGVSDAVFFGRSHDRKSVELGEGVSVRLDFCGWRIIQKKKKKT